MPKLQKLQCKEQGKEEDHVKSCRDEVEEDLNIMGIDKRGTVRIR